MNDIIPQYVVRELASHSGRIHGEVTTINDNLLAVGVPARRRDKVYDGTRHFLGAVEALISFSEQFVEYCETNLPALPAGTGIMPKPTWFTPFGCARRAAVIWDSYTPGATPHTRTGIFFSANSVASIFVRWAAAALELL